MSELAALVREFLEAEDAVEAEARRAEKNGGRGWSSAPVIRRHYAVAALREATSPPPPRELDNAIVNAIIAGISSDDNSTEQMLAIVERLKAAGYEIRPRPCPEWQPIDREELSRRLSKVLADAMSWHPSENGPSYTETRNALHDRMVNILSQGASVEQA